MSPRVFSCMYLIGSVKLEVLEPVKIESIRISSRIVATIYLPMFDCRGTMVCLFTLMDSPTISMY
jgi:hypothetical protein